MRGTRLHLCKKDIAQHYTDISAQKKPRVDTQGLNLDQ